VSHCRLVREAVVVVESAMKMVWEMRTWCFYEDGLDEEMGEEMVAQSGDEAATSK